MKELTEGEALNKAAGYCTLCERCRYEVSTKLTAWGVEHSVQEHILQRLESEGFIDESRYCKAFVNDKLRFNHWGRLKIVAAMRQKHLQQSDINNAIAQIDEEQYIDILKNLIQTKSKELKNDDHATKQKIIRFVASRGFEPSLIFDHLGYNSDF